MSIREPLTGVIFLLAQEQTDEMIEPEQWQMVEESAGVVVRRDPDGTVTVQPYPTDADLAAAWSAIMVEYEPGEPGSPPGQSPESDDNPT